MFLLGGVFSAQFGMAPVFGAEAGLSVAQISAFVATFFIGSLVLQYPIGWLSDRMDRRVLILGTAVICGLGALLGLLFSGFFGMLLVAGIVIGGMSNPLYSLLIAHTNDFLDHDDMAAAAGGMVFINGVGAVAGPLLTGWIMGLIGPRGFFLYIALLMVALAGYAAWRMTRRPAPAVEETDSYTTVMPSASPMAVTLAQEYDIETAQDAADDTASVT